MAAAAAHYREQAAKMRSFAANASNANDRSNFIHLAAEYDRLAERAEQRQMKPNPSRR